MFQLPSNLSEVRNTWRIINGIEPQPGKLFFRNAAPVDRPSFYISGVIGENDDDATTFVNLVHSNSAPEIDLFINSVGGFYFDAVSIYDALTTSPAKVNVIISGLAASAASVIAMAGDTVKIAKQGRMMIHDAQGIVAGSPAEVREYADILENLSNDISEVYAKRAGKKASYWRKAMSATTWYSSGQAVDEGLADSFTEQSSEGPDSRTKLIQARHRVLTGRK